MDIDIILITLPKVEIRSPLVGPAALKAMCKKHGFNAVTLDLNIDLWRRQREKTPHWWIQHDQTFVKEDLFNKAWDTYIDGIASEWCDQIKALNPRFVGITVMSDWTKLITTKIVEKINTTIKNQKIILGGPGIDTSFYGPDLLKEKKIYAYVEGEGEYALINILQGNLNYPGINGNPPQQITNLDILPFPDYSDADLSRYSDRWWEPEYDSKGANYLYITGSRGCIKRCNFCNVGNIWPKFIRKKGKTIANELEYYVKKTGIRRFYFTDSLLNGDINQLTEMSQEILNKQLKIKWKGQWIVRGPKVLPPEVYELISKAGCNQVIIGIESGSNKVRNDMKKGVLDQDIEYTFEQCYKNKIKTIPLMMIGYPTETDELFEETIAFLRKYQKFALNGTIMFLGLGYPTVVYKDTPMYNKFIAQGMTYDEHGHWVYNDNNMKKRIERWFRLKQEAEKLGYPILDTRITVLVDEYRKITGLNIIDV